MTVETRSGVHPEGFSSGDITGTTLKGVKRGSPRRVLPEGVLTPLSFFSPSPA